MQIGGAVNQAAVLSVVRHIHAHVSDSDDRDD